MKHEVVFSTRTGNTRAVAEAIREELGEENVSFFGSPADHRESGDGVVFAGFWTNRGMPDEESAAFLKGLRNRKVFLFGTAGFGESDAYYKAILKRAEDMLDGSVTVVGSYMCQGRMPQSVRDRYDRMQDSPQALPNLASLIENFDRALSHPDEKDLGAARKAVSGFRK